MLRLAAIRAAEGKLREAIEIARRTDSRGEFAELRAKFMKTFQEELKTKRPR